MSTSSTRRGPKPTGELLRFADGFGARIRYMGERLTLSLDGCASEAEAIDRKAALASMGARLARSPRATEGKDLLERAARAQPGKAWGAFVEAVDDICSGKVEEVTEKKVPTFETFAKDWTSGALHTKHPDHVTEKDARRDKEHLKNYINPVLGPLRLNEITLAHAEDVMGKIPVDRAPGTRKAVAQCMRKALSYAVYPGRHIAANPIPSEWMPKARASARRAKGALWPEDDAKLLACTRIPFLRRLAYGLLAREGLRASEAADLRWSAVDLEHGRIQLDVNKTKDPRAWALGDDVHAALTLWKAMVEAKLEDGAELDGNARVLEEDGVALDVTCLARSLRNDLKKAGVKRAELYESTASRMQIRAHDLRALFVTANLANGRTETWVRDRTGHRSSQMVATYTRQARSWGELKLGTLAPLDGALPELAHCPATAQKVAPPGRFERPANALGIRANLSREHLFQAVP